MAGGGPASERCAIWAFVLGCVAVTAGVVLHLPMFLMARDMGYRLAGKAMDDGMLAGMALIVGGVLLAGYGLLPRGVAARRAAILLSAVMFVGTSICGAMPSLAWNIGMCFMMGLAAGGMPPITYALLAEMMPSRHRGWSLVLVGGLGGAGGYFAASGASALLQPLFGWRTLWLIDLPAGLLLIVLGAFIPAIVVPACAWFGRETRGRDLRELEASMG